MELRKLLKNIKPVAIKGNEDIDVTGVNINSRLIGKGNLFIAMKGTQVDGHRFIGGAVEAGAVAVMCEELPSELDNGVTYVQVESTEDAAGKVATVFYGEPSKKLKLVGVTGTNGKTTIATLLYNMFTKLGYKCGLLSTVCNYIVDEKVPADHTTPDPIELNALLARMVEAGCEYAFMECSSHAIAQKRIGGLHFAGGVFTNLTRDHLDYHKTFENYRNAKKAFFDGLPKTAFAITNADDKNGMVMVQNTKAVVKTYSMRSMADFKGRLLECHFEGMYLEIDGREVGVQFIGKFNLSNLLAVYGAAVMLGQKPEDVLLVLSTLPRLRRQLTLQLPPLKLRLLSKAQRMLFLRTEQLRALQWSAQWIVPQSVRAPRLMLFTAPKIRAPALRAPALRTLVLRWKEHQALMTPCQGVLLSRPAALRVSLSSPLSSRKPLLRPVLLGI